MLVDLEDVGQQLIEDNIVSVSRQMIDKEASVPSAAEQPLGNGKANGRGAQSRQAGGMEIDGEDEEL